jgi:hypothetical protein
MAGKGAFNNYVTHLRNPVTNLSIPAMFRLQKLPAMSFCMQSTRNSHCLSPLVSKAKNPSGFNIAEAPLQR